MTPYEKLMALHGRHLADKAVEYTAHHNRHLWSDNTRTASGLLSCGFTWRETREGHKFWEKVTMSTERTL